MCKYVVGYINLYLDAVKNERSEVVIDINGKKLETFTFSFVIL